MPLQTIALTIVFGSVGLGLVILVLAARRARVRALERADEALRGEAIILRDTGASFFGLASRGKGQVRGNGVLVLTDRQLWFHMWLPSRELALPLESITAVSTPRSHLGKSVGMPLLAVHLADGDVAAWCLRGVDGWKDALRSAGVGDA
jgi:hypothetical protein